MKARLSIVLSSTIIAGCSLLIGCSTQPDPQARNTPHSFCQKLQQQMAVGEANTQPGVSSSPTNQAMLLHRYKNYDCPALLNPETSNTAKQEAIIPPPKPVKKSR